MSVAIIPDFVKYQIDWLTSHKGLEFEPVIEDTIVQMLKDTGKSFIDEQAVETSQFDHIVESNKKVEQTAETAQNTSSSCAHENDLVFRKMAIEALARMMPRSYTPDGSHPADEEIFRAQEIFADCIEALEILPSAQPEPAIPLQWIEAQIEWLKSLDNAFSTLTAGQISAMVNKWRDEQDE